MALQVHQVALAAVTELRPVVAVIARHDRSLAQQLRTAASSMVLNIGEAERSDPGTGRARLFSAAGSTRETRSALELAVAWGYLSPALVAPAEAELDRVAAMLHRLTHARA
ncbi:MAG: four helix bundle protein [Lentisphaeria bacterium]